MVLTILVSRSLPMVLPAFTDSLSNSGTPGTYGSLTYNGALDLDGSCVRWCSHVLWIDLDLGAPCSADSSAFYGAIRTYDSLLAHGAL